MRMARVLCAAQRVDDQQVQPMQREPPGIKIRDIRQIRHVAQAKPQRPDRAMLHLKRALAPPGPSTVMSPSIAFISKIGG